MENRKKEYTAPKAQRIVFDYREQVIASAGGGECATTVVRTFEGCDRIYCTPRYTA